MSSSVTKYYDMLEDQEWERQQILKQIQPTFSILNYILSMFKFKKFNYGKRSK